MSGRLPNGRVCSVVVLPRLFLSDELVLFVCRVCRDGTVRCGRRVIVGSDDPDAGGGSSEGDRSFHRFRRRDGEALLVRSLVLTALEWGVKMSITSVFCALIHASSWSGLSGRSRSVTARSTAPTAVLSALNSNLTVNIRPM